MFHLFNWSRNKKKSKIDEGMNVVEGISKAKKLYKELILKSHPDKHFQKEQLAKELTELINNNRYNYRELLNLKERIEKELLSNE